MAFDSIRVWVSHDLPVSHRLLYDMLNRTLAKSILGMCQDGCMDQLDRQLPSKDTENAFRSLLKAFEQVRQPEVQFIKHKGDMSPTMDALCAAAWKNWLIVCWLNF